MHHASRFAIAAVVVSCAACTNDPNARPPDDAAVDELRLFNPPDARTSDTGPPTNAGPSDAGTDAQWDLFVLRLLVEPPSGSTGWDADGTVNPAVTVTVGSDTGTTTTRSHVPFVSGWAGAAWIEPVVVTSESALLAGIDVSLADDDGGTPQPIASCHLAIDTATLAGRLASLSCAPGTVGYAGSGRFDTRIGLRPHGDTAAVPGSGPSVWEIRMSHVTISPTDESGAAWDASGGAPDPTISIAMLDDGPGTDVAIPVTTRLADDTLDAAFDPPLVIARLPDEIRDFPGQRDISAFWRLFDDDDGTLVPMDTCDLAPTSGPAPAGSADVGSTFCLFDTVDEAVWTIDYRAVRFGDGWL